MDRLSFPLLIIQGTTFLMGSYRPTMFWRSAVIWLSFCLLCCVSWLAAPFGLLQKLGPAGVLLWLIPCTLVSYKMCWVPKGPSARLAPYPQFLQDMIPKGKQKMREDKELSKSSHGKDMQRKYDELAEVIQDGPVLETMTLRALSGGIWLTTAAGVVLHWVMWSVVLGAAWPGVGLWGGVLIAGSQVWMSATRKL